MDRSPLKINRPLPGTEKENAGREVS